VLCNVYKQNYEGYSKREEKSAENLKQPIPLFVNFNKLLAHLNSPCIRF